MSGRIYVFSNTYNDRKQAFFNKSSREPALRFREFETHSVLSERE